MFDNIFSRSNILSPRLGYMIFLWASVFQNQKFRDIFVVKNLIFSKNLSSLEQPRNFNLICDPFYQANYKVDKVGLSGDIVVY